MLLSRLQHTNGLLCNRRKPLRAPALEISPRHTQHILHGRWRLHMFRHGIALGRLHLPCTHDQESMQYISWRATVEWMAVYSVARLEEVV